LRGKQSLLEQTAEAQAQLDACASSWAEGFLYAQKTKQRKRSTKSHKTTLTFSVSWCPFVDRVLLELLTRVVQQRKAKHFSRAVISGGLQQLPLPVVNI